MKTFKFMSFAFVIILSGVLLSACTPTTSTDTQNTPPPGNVNPVTPPASAGKTISLKGMNFSPSNLTVKVGDTVTWNNDDNTTHTITEEDNEFDSGTVSKGKTFSFTFTKAGTYTYHCELHPTMRGTITVTE